MSRTLVLRWSESYEHRTLIRDDDGLMGAANALERALTDAGFMSRSRVCIDLESVSFNIEEK